MATIRGRYAPSPTGELHLGNMRTALVAWLATRAARGTFVMRIEDLDPPRVIPGAEARLLEDLRWLGMDWDEGPDLGGPHAPYRQSERQAVYVEALQRLEAAGRLYGCSCSRAALRRLASAPHGASDDGPAYPGLCRDSGLPLALDAPASARGGLAAVRFRVEPAEVCFEDRLAGRFCQDVERDVGDFVVRRADGLFAYQLAVVVDDGAMGINQVVRGADLLDSTPRQLQLQAALGLSTPEYAHVPLVLDQAGERLAKRDRAMAIRALREAGATPEQLLGVLGASLGLLDQPRPTSAGALVDRFDWQRIARTPWRANADALPF